MEPRNMKIAFHTLGCKVNIYETEVMKEQAEAWGATTVPFDTPADVYVINTCSVTNMADRKSRSYIRRVRKQNEDAVVVACGCYVETAEESVVREAGADLLLGSDQKKDFIRILQDYLERGIVPAAEDIAKSTAFPRMTLHRLSDHTRADIKVQDGCNQFCSYCIIPYARGRIRSRELPDIVSEIRELSEKGVREFVLTGIHLSSYGKDFPESSGDEFLQMVEKVHEIPGVQRIRFGSLEPRIVTEDFAKRLSALPKVCPQFHLSLQSGADRTLQRMNRHYTAEEYRKSCEILRKYFNDPALTTDVIAGFPGETEEDFRESLEFVRSIGFYELHVFKYSRRKGTVADRMPDQVPEDQKTARSEQLLQLSQEMSESYRKRHEGKHVEVLTEQEAVFRGEKVLLGFTKEYIRCAVPLRCGENRIVSGILHCTEDPEIMLLSPDQGR